MDVTTRRGVYATASPSAAQEGTFPLQYLPSSMLNESERDGTRVTREIIDEDGDVLLKAGCKEFLASHKVLAVASTVFRAMFTPGFQEGDWIRDQKHALELELPDDDPQALRLILKILHFSPRPRNHTPHIDLQLQLAQLADKYNCMVAIETDIKLWLNDYTIDSHSPWTLLTAISIAFLLRHEKEYTKFTNQIALQAPRHSLEQPLPPIVLPNDFQEEICRLRERIMYSIINEIETTILNVSQRGIAYKNGTELCLGCEYCERLTKEERDQLWDREHWTVRYCDRGSRVIEFLEILTREEIWPLSQHYEEDVETLMDRLKALPEATYNRHCCDEREDCPLIRVPQDLRTRVEEIVERAEGLDFARSPEYDEWTLHGSGL